MNKIIEIITTNLDLDPTTINEDTNLLVDLKINSFDLVTLVCEFEDAFDIQISEREIKRIETIKDIEHLIKNKK